MPRDLRRVKGVKKDTSIIVIASEGEITEPGYFNHLKGLLRNTRVQIESIPSKDGKSAPEHIIKNLDEFAEKYQIQDDDSLWIVIDFDTWGVKKLKKIAQQAKQKKYSLAVSRPCFEFWLVLHHSEWSEIAAEFHCNDEVNDKQTCAKTLKKKSQKEMSSYSLKSIKMAVERAKNHDTERGRWTLECPGTRVHKLLSLILEKSGESNKL